MTAQRISIVQPQEMRQTVRRGKCRDSEGPATSSPRDSQTPSLISRKQYLEPLSFTWPCQPEQATCGLALPEDARIPRAICTQHKCHWLIVTPVSVSRTATAVIRGPASQAGGGIHIPGSM